jgi:transcriptional regulator with XRE-family HTH domain
MAVENWPRQILVMPKPVPPPNMIRKWRKRAGLTLEAAAEKIGQTAGNLSAMERGAQGYSRETLEALADLYGAEEPGFLLSVDPEADIFPIWEDASPDERAQIVAVARALTGKAPQ